MLQTILHYGIHFLIPIAVSLIFYKHRWKYTLLILLSTMIIDLDHLLASPIYDASRCSIGFHPLHSYVAIGVYVILLFPKVTIIIALGLCIHMLADYVDCLFM